MVGVLKSILQIFFGMFAFDQLAVNLKTVTGIVLSLFAGTMFSYLEYTRKKMKSTASMIDTTSDQQKHRPRNVLVDEHTVLPNLEKFVNLSLILAVVQLLFMLTAPCF